MWFLGLFLAARETHPQIPKVMKVCSKSPHREGEDLLNLELSFLPPHFDFHLQLLDIHLNCLIQGHRWLHQSHRLPQRHLLRSLQLLRFLEAIYDRLHWLHLELSFLRPHFDFHLQLLVLHLNWLTQGHRWLHQSHRLLQINRWLS